MLVNLKRIRKQRTEKSQEVVARELGIPVGTYIAWEQTRNTPRANELKLLADYFGCTVDDLFGRSDRPLPPGAVPARVGGFVSRPCFGAIAAGAPIEMLEVDDWREVPEAVAAKYPNGFFLEVRGTSMDKVLPEFSYAYINPCESAERQGGVYALNVNGDSATIKRVRRLANGYELVPDSTDPTYKPLLLDHNDPATPDVRIIGEVVYYVMPYDWQA